MHIDLSVPIWTIHHVAAALGVEVDTAREHTYTASFPAPAEGFAKNLWLREEVLAWFAGLPRTDRRRRDGARSSRLFWTQHVIGSRYIADFYCPAARLVIEVDGDSHDDRAAEDRRRDDVMHEYGFRVLRLANVTVLADAGAAVSRIVRTITNPQALDAQRRQEEARRKAQTVLAKQQAQVRQRPLRAPLKARFRCTWCLAEFVTALEPRPSCRPCQTFELLPICYRCGWRRCGKPREMCHTCADASDVARGAIGTPVEHVNRNSRHRVRKIM